MTIKNVGPRKARVVSKSGRNLGTSTGRTLKEARHKAHIREGQVKAFKKRG